MAGQDGSSEELVEDDSGEEEYQQEDESSASYDSEEDEGGDDADDFETPQKARKRRRVAPTPDPGPKTPRRTPTRTPPAATNTNTATNSSKKKAGNAAPKNIVGKEVVATGGKGKGRAPTKPPPEASSSLSTPSGDGFKSDPGGKSQTASPLPGTGSTGAGGASGSGSSSGSAPVSSSASSNARTTTATTSATATTGSKNANPGTAGPAPAKTPKAAVSDYMLQSNRPYSCINVFDNLRKKIPKPMVQKLLDELTRGGTLKMQEYGKAKIYYANQTALPNGAGDVSEGKMQKLEQDAKDFTSKLEAASAQAREAQSRANALSAQPSDASLDEKLASTALDLERMEAKNAAAKGQGRGNVAGGMKAAKASANKYRALWLSRKRNAMDVVDMICDGMDKKTKVVLDMIGLEPDEGSVPAKM